MADTPRGAGWEGPASGKRQHARFLWRNLLWALIFPRREQQMLPTMAGVLLIALSLGIGTAAYNSSNNILFITLALLLACLILSGVLSWFNFAKVLWRFVLPPVVRAGQSAALTVELINTKTLLPTYGLECLVGAQPVADEGMDRPQTTFTAKGKDVRAILKKAAAEQAVEKLRLRTRLDPQESVQLPWAWSPPHRGRWSLELKSVGSLFPFGFFNKRLSSRLRHVVIVWPAPVAYQWHAAPGTRRSGETARLQRLGGGSDLRAMRRYTAGDSHRLIHWKASARTRQLLVRQFADESTESYTLWVPTNAEIWTRPEQFERMVGLAATLAEDLFRAGKLRAMGIGETAIRPVRQVRDLEAQIDELAVLKFPEPNPAKARTGPVRLAMKRNVLTFAPDGAAGAAALIDGTQAATA